MKKKFVYQVGNTKKLYYDARPTKYQDKQIKFTCRYDSKSFLEGGIN